MKKILTYSDLRLDYKGDDDEERDRSEVTSERIEEEKDTIIEVPPQIISKRDEKIASSVEDSNFEIKKQP